MRADILNDGEGTLRLTPHSATEETMLKIWFADESKNTKQIKDIVMVDSYEDMGPACIKSIEETAGKVENMSAMSKKELRKVLKVELDELEVEYNGRASTSVLQTILEKVKLQRASGKVEKEVTDVESPAPEPPTEKPQTATEVAEAQKAISKRLAKKESKTTVATVDITLDTVREALKKFAATKGTTAAKKLLANYEATKISELKEVIYPEFLVDADVG